jgi:hypothetical protein
MSAALTSSMLAMRDRSSERPARTGFTWPSRLVPAPKGVTATPCAWHSARMRLTSSVVSAKATQSGSVGVVVSSPRLCCWRMASTVDSRSPSRGRRPAITAWAGDWLRVFMTAFSSAQKGRSEGAASSPRDAQLSCHFR